jgi:signal transduction histidine kinase
VLRQNVERRFDPGIAGYPGWSALVSGLRDHRRLPRRLALVIALVILAVTALLDYFSLFQLDLSVLYLIPICIVAWNLGRRSGLVFSLFAVVVWFINQDITEQLLPHAFLLFPHSFFHYWKAALLLGASVGTVILLDKLKIALAHADERFQTVLEGLQDSVYVVDDESDALLYLNHRCRETFGAGAPLLQARQIEDALQPGSPGARAERGVEFFDPVRKRWFLVHARKLRWVDGRSVTLKMAADITERKQAEEVSRQQQQKLQQISHLVTVGEMASTLAHEINQPLAAIANYSMGCVRRMRSGSWNADEILSAMEKASEQSERAGRIIQRVRELVRRREPMRSDCDINAMITDIANLIEIDAEKNGVRVGIELDQNVPVVQADKIMLEQAILNMTRNGIESMSETPRGERELTIRTRSGAPEDTVEIEITDSGCGIPASMDQSLFEPFFTTKPEGLGMGLSICRSIVEFHDGRLSASRNAGRGSTFLLSLPVH